MLKFNNVEKLKTMWKMLKTPNGESPNLHKIAKQPCANSDLKKKTKKCYNEITERKEIKMKHYYELRRFENDGTIKTVLRISDEPKYAKQRAKEYAKRNTGVYSLEKVEKVTMYFTEKE